MPFIGSSADRRPLLARPSLPRRGRSGDLFIVSLGDGWGPTEPTRPDPKQANAVARLARSTHRCPPRTAVRIAFATLPPVPPNRQRCSSTARARFSHSAYSPTVRVPHWGPAPLAHDLSAGPAQPPAFLPRHPAPLPAWRSPPPPALPNRLRSSSGAPHRCSHSACTNSYPALSAILRCLSALSQACALFVGHLPGRHPLI